MSRAQYVFCTVAISMSRKNCLCVWGACTMDQEPCMLGRTMWTQKGELRAVLRLAFGLLKLTCLREKETEFESVISCLGTCGCLGACWSLGKHWHPQTLDSLAGSGAVWSLWGCWVWYPSSHGMVFGLDKKQGVGGTANSISWHVSLLSPRVRQKPCGQQTRHSTLDYYQAMLSKVCSC